MKLESLEKALKASNKLKALREADKQSVLGSDLCITGTSLKGYQIDVTINSRNVHLFAGIFLIEMEKVENELEALGVEIEQEIPGVV